MADCNKEPAVAMDDSNEQSSKSNDNTTKEVAGSSSGESPNRKTENTDDVRDSKTIKTSNDTENSTSQEHEDSCNLTLSESNFRREVSGGESDDSSSTISSTSSSSTSSSNSTSSTFSLLNQLRREQALKEPDVLPEVLQKTQPKHKWFIIPEVSKREVGFSNRCSGAQKFQDRAYGSLHSVQRLELMYKLEKHSGCVNSLGFSESGDLLASCSDDLKLCLWDWPAGKLITTIKTGHKNNVFQCKFLPLRGHMHIATCARDGDVRLIEVDGSGSLRGIRRLGQHSAPPHKLAIIAGSQHCFLSCGEDAVVLHYDIRQRRPHRIMRLKEADKLIPLYSIGCHPLDENEFMVGGKDRYLRLYDRRALSTPVRKVTPSNLLAAKSLPAYVTSAVYSYNGTELLASYNDDDIYLWDRTDSSNNDFVHRYQGHRNKATVKGVNFFGPRSEFIISGSDCGYIYFWEKESEAIVQWMEGDENGVVNCLEPHPSIPILATSGLDDDIKIWVPSKEEGPDLQNGLRQTVIRNMQSREDERSDEHQAADDIDTQRLWILWRHLTSSQRARLNRRGGGSPPGRLEELFERSRAAASASDSDAEDPRPDMSNCSPS